MLAESQPSIDSPGLSTYQIDQISFCVIDIAAVTVSIMLARKLVMPMIQKTLKKIKRTVILLNIILIA